MKGAVGYITKGAHGSMKSSYEHLQLNGGAGAHWSRGYFGVPIAEVIGAMGRGRYGDQEGNWVKHPDHAHDGASCEAGELPRMTGAGAPIAPVNVVVDRPRCGNRTVAIRVESQGMLVLRGGKVVTSSVEIVHLVFARWLRLRVYAEAWHRRASFAVWGRL